MDKIKNAFEKIVQFSRKEKVSKGASIVALVVVFARVLLQSFQNTLSFVGTDTFPELFAEAVKLMQQPIFIVMSAIIGALIVWGIFEGISGGFYNMFAPRGLTVGTKNEFKGIARFAFIVIELITMLFLCLFYIPKVGPRIVADSQRFLQIILYTVFYTLAYILLEDKSIIRAHVADAYFPLQRLYKIYYGLSVGLGAITSIKLWNEGGLSIFAKIIFFLEIAVVAAYFILVPYFMQILKKRQEAARQFRTEVFSEEGNIKDALEKMGIHLGESYEIYSPSTSIKKESEVPTKDDIVITVEPKEDSLENDNNNDSADES